MRARRTQRRHQQTSSWEAEPLEVRQLLTNFYIDPVNGSDANAGTSEATAYRTPRNLSFAFEQSPEFHKLEAGDTVFLRDGVHDWSGLLAENPATAQDAAFWLFQCMGTAEAPITIQAYPGEKPIIRAREAGEANSALLISQSSYVRVLGLEVTGTFGPGLRSDESNHLEIAHNYIHDVDGVYDDNIAGLYVTDMKNSRIHHNLLHDNYDRLHAAKSEDLRRENSRNIVIFGDQSDRVEVDHNKVFNTPRADGNPAGAGIWIKHASAIPGATFEIHDNIVRDVQVTGIGSHNTGAHVHHNLLVNAAAYLTSPDDGVSISRGHLVEFNTYVGSGAFNLSTMDGSGFYPDQNYLQFRRNIVVDGALGYTADNGIIRLDPYGTDEDYAQLATTQNLQFDDNVYFNANTSPVWNLFGSDTDPIDPSPTGGLLDFAAWQALGYDPNSQVLNPQLGAAYAPANPAAAGAGWLAGPDPRLTLYLPQDLVSETGAPVSLIIVRSGVSLSSPQVVTLSTTDSTEIQLPTSVTIPAGVSSISVPLTPVNDHQVERTRAVQIFAAAATAAGTLAGSEWIRVLQATASQRPVLSGIPASRSYTENGGGVLLAPSATVADADSSTFPGGQLLVQYTAGALATDRLTMRHQGTGPGQVGVNGSQVLYGGTVVGSIAGGEGTAALKISLNAAATPAATQALLRNVLYRNVSDNPTNFGANPTRSLRFRASDGAGGVSAFVNQTLTVAAVQDAPAIGGFDSAITYTENGTGNIIDSNATVSDPDTTNFNGGRLTISLTANAQASDRLTIRSQGTAAGQIGVSGGNVTHSGTVIGTFAGGVGTQPLVVTFNANATPAKAQALLRNVLFSNVSDNPSTSPRTVRVQLEAISGQNSSSPTKTVNVAARNDASVVTGFSDDSAYSRGAGATILDSNATVADVDSTDFEAGSLTLQVSQGAASTNRLAVRNQGTAAGQIGVSGSNITFGGVVMGTLNANGGVGLTALVVTFNATATPAAAQALLRNLTYRSAAANPIGPLTLMLKLRDGDGGLTTVNKTLNINSALASIPRSSGTAYASYEDWKDSL